MKPAVVLLGFVLGSAAAITFALGGVAIVFAVLRPDYPRLAGELPSLLVNLGLFAALTVTAALSFYGQVRGRPWRVLSIGLLLVGLGLVGWMQWPR
jgi:hypothetical protein